MTSTRKCVLGLLLIASLGLSACTPEKARALKTAVVQFRGEALAAVNHIEALLKKEIEPAPRSQAATTEEFVRNVLSSQKPRLNADDIRLALDPYAVAPDPSLEARRAAFLGELRLQYSTFASIFDEVEGGSFLARDAVRRSGEPAEKLTLQMAAFAESVNRYPPQLLQYRTALLQKINDTRKDANLSDAEKGRRLAEMADEWRTLEAAEAELQRSTVEQCLKAAELGFEVQRLIQEYDRLSLDDLNFYIARALGTASALTGKNLDGLKARSSELFARIKQDSTWSSVADQALNRINDLRKPAD